MHAPSILVWLAGPDGNCRFANPALEHFTGLSQSQIRGADWRTFLVEEDRSGAAESWQTALTRGTPFHARVHVRGIDGRATMVDLSGFGQKTDDGAEVWLFTGLPISDHMHQAPALETELQTMLNIIPAYTWYALPSGALTFVNERCAAYLGLPPDHPVRLGIHTGAAWDSHIPLLHPDDHEETRRVWSNCLRTGCAGEVTFRVRSAEGVYRWFLSRAEPLRSTDGSLLYWIGVNLDIDDAKVASQALQESQFHLAEGERLAHMGSWGYDPGGFFTYWSPELFRIHGLDPAGGPPTLAKYLERIHASDREFMASLAHRLGTEAYGFDVTKRIVRPTGEVRHIRCVGTPVMENGSLRRLVGMALDVTDQEMLTQELRRSKAHLTNAQRLSHTGNVGLDVTTKRLFWSEEAARIYGYPPETEPTPELILQRVHPDDREIVKDVLNRAAGGSVDFDFEHRLLMPDGSIKYIYNLAQSVKDKRGHEEILGAIVDITEHRLAADNIRRSEAFLAEAQRVSHTGSFGWKPDRDEIVWSDETYRIFEYNRDVTPTLELIAQRVHPEDLPIFDEAIRSAPGRGTDFEHAYRLLTPGGQTKHLHVRAQCRRDAEGAMEFIGAVTDITERKLAEERIRERELELHHMMDLTPQFVALFGPQRERLYANRVALDYLGLSLDEWRRGTEGAEVHPDESERLKAHSSRALLNGLDYDLEVRVRKSDGTYRWFLARYHAVRDERGQTTRWFVACTDIEDRKQAEDKLRNENVALREEIEKTSMFEEIIGTAPALRTVLARLSKVAPSDSTVLITGETGTGKELIARGIHRQSRRASRPFIAVNCAAIPRDLIQSELFGHEKGAFTGATQRHVGRFELADGGTIFLDEVGDLSASSQVALLRVLQEREIERIGSEQSIRVDVRVIAATNRDLKAAVPGGTFREDLFYRLNVFPIPVPPLRERKEDILMLVEYFVQRYASKAGKNVRSIDKKTLAILQSYDWPGNIRELQNVIERSVILSPGGVLSVDELWFPKEAARAQPANEGSRPSKRIDQQRSEREIIEQALAETRGRVSGPCGAAAKLGIPPSTLATRIRTLKISRHQFKFRSS